MTDRWYADLPDTGFFYPGDIIHYYFEASDDLGGAVETATLPQDTTGFSVIDPYNPLNYNSSFTVRALPTIDGSLGQPGVLFWNDFANRGGQAEWHGAFANLGLLAGRDFDVYYTNGPSSGVGDGLGGRATASLISGYDDILYTAGDLGVNTIANGDFNSDPSNDAEVLDLWLRSGGKDFFATGDNLASDMSQAGSITSAFLADQMGISVASDDIRPLIDFAGQPPCPGRGQQPRVRHGVQLDRLRRLPGHQHVRRGRAPDRRYAHCAVRRRLGRSGWVPLLGGHAERSGLGCARHHDALRPDVRVHGSQRGSPRRSPTCPPASAFCVTFWRTSACPRCRVT